MEHKCIWKYLFFLIKGKFQKEIQTRTRRQFLRAKKLRIVTNSRKLKVNFMSLVDFIAMYIFICILSIIEEYMVFLQTLTILKKIDDVSKKLMTSSLFFSPGKCSFYDTLSLCKVLVTMLVVGKLLREVEYTLALVLKSPKKPSTNRVKTTNLKNIFFTPTVIPQKQINLFIPYDKTCDLNETIFSFSTYLFSSQNTNYTAQPIVLFFCTL